MNRTVFWSSFVCLYEHLFSHFCYNVAKLLLLYLKALVHLCCYTVVTLLAYCWYTVVTLLLHCWHTVVTLLLHCWHTVGTLLVHCWHTVGTLLVHCWHTVVTLLLHCWYTVVTLLLHCCYCTWGRLCVCVVSRFHVCSRLEHFKIRASRWWNLTKCNVFNFCFSRNVH
jgi:hypothetical protein